jgi:hypothetical protein
MDLYSIVEFHLKDNKKLPYIIPYLIQLLPHDFLIDQLKSVKVDKQDKKCDVKNKGDSNDGSDQV